MKMDRQTAEKEIFSLLRQWCDRLLSLQLHLPGQKEFDGGILCPACKMIHGRCGDAIYPLMFLADKTGLDQYRLGAQKLFAWSENMLCDDGSLYNDAQHPWNGITVFSAVALHDALLFHGHILEEPERAKWESRLAVMGEWLHEKLVIGMPTNINYFATNACAMALLGRYFHRSDYTELARKLAAYCMQHISENDLLFGEGKPHDASTLKKCKAIDVGGYNVEESLPSLCRYAETVGDAALIHRLKGVYRAHVKWMLPDGAWDNSVGSRVFKWTYWGSRTSDGCQEALFQLGKQESVFSEAAWRNFTLYQRCTHDGLLYGGPDYHAWGEKPCVHHTFCHAKALAGALDEGLCDWDRVPLPADQPDPLQYYPEMDTYRIGCGDWLSDVTGYDFHYTKGGHASGGAVSLLWHRQRGPVIASGMVDYSLVEVTNQQLSRKKAAHRSPCPRIEVVMEGKRWGQQYDFGAVIRQAPAPDGVRLHVDAFLCDQEYHRMPGDGGCTLDYHFTPEGLSIHGQTAVSLANTARYILPVVESSHAQVTVLTGRLQKEAEEMFSLNPGLIYREYTISPDDNGRFQVKIGV